MHIAVQPHPHPCTLQLTGSSVDDTPCPGRPALQALLLGRTSSATQHQLHLPAHISAECRALQVFRAQPPARR